MVLDYPNPQNLDVGQNAEFVGWPDIRVILRKKSHQLVVPPQREFDINLSHITGGFESVAIRNRNIFFDPDLGVAMIRPLFANRNNFVENISALPTRFRVDVPAGAPPESSNEIAKRIWKAQFTVNQFGRFKKKDQDFADPGEFETVNGESVTNQYSGPIWAEEFHHSTATGDFAIKKAPPVSWVHQKNSNPNCEWFISQKFGNFTNESFWIDVRRFQSESPSGLSDKELDSSNIGNRLKRYKTKFPLANHFTIRIGAVDSSDSNAPGGYDIVFPVDRYPFIYDHLGDGVTTGSDEESPIVTNDNYAYNGYIASIKSDPSWILSNVLEEFRVYVFFLRGKMIIKTSWSDGSWLFPDNLATQPNESTVSRYENFFIKASKISLLGRGMKCRFNYNPLEFDIYDDDGKERQNRNGEKYHGSLTTFPMQTRSKAPKTFWKDFSGTRNKETDKQVFTIIPIEKDTNDISGNPTEFSFGFDFVTARYDRLSGGEGLSGNYTSMMIAVNPQSVPSIEKTIRTKMRPPTSKEGFIEAGPAVGFEAQISTRTALFQNRLLEVELACRPPEVGPNVDGGSDESGHIHKRFASPILWRLKGVQNNVSPVNPGDIDISDFVKGISYETVAPDMLSVEQKYTVEIFVPKNWQFDRTPTVSGNVSGDGNNVDQWALYSNHPVLSFGVGTTNREKFLSLFYDGVREVEIWLGWYGSQRWEDGAMINPEGTTSPRRKGLFQTGTNSGNNSSITGLPMKPNSSLVKVFTGLAMGGPMKESYGEDILQLNCVDKTEILKSNVILNSPFFDGMTLDKAFLAVGTLTGLPRDLFNVASPSAFCRTLPMGFSFQEPEYKFAANTTLFDAIKEITNQWKHVLRVDPHGKITLDDLYPSNPGSVFDILEDLPLSHEGFVFHVDGYIDSNTQSRWRGGGIAGTPTGRGTQNPFQRIYESFSSDKNVGAHKTQVLIASTDRNEGSLIFAGDLIDVDAIEDPSVTNFIGYHSPWGIVQPAFGSKKKVREFQSLVGTHVLQSPFSITFETFGRPTLRPMDIIEVVHQDRKNVLINRRGEITNTSSHIVKYRVVSISGKISLQASPFYYSMTVNAIHQ